MKNNDLNGNRDIEKKLKDKMNELSSSVDCFDKISARAFPENNADFWGSEFTVSDLENVTGKHRGLPVLKWAAVAAAVVLCVGLLPKTGLPRKFYTSLGKDTDVTYRAVLSEMLKETEKHEYRVYDLPLQDYIENDVLVTPYYSCPFGESARDDVKVRLFIRTAGDTLTNQIYAVEYAGSYTEANFIAVAESAAKFTDEELETLEKNNSGWGYSEVVDDRASMLFTSGRYGELVDYKGNEATAASFTYNEYFKYGDEIYQLCSGILYYKMKDDENETYYYDIYPEDIRNGGSEIVEIPESKELWNCSVNFDGSSAMPVTSGSRFEKTSVFDNFENKGSSRAFYMPLMEASEELMDNRLHKLEMHRVELADMGITDTLHIPADMNEKRSLHVYFPSAISFLQFSSYSDPRIEIHSDAGNTVIEIREADICSNSGYYWIIHNDAEDIDWADHFLPDEESLRRQEEEDRARRAKNDSAAEKAAEEALEAEKERFSLAAAELEEAAKREEAAAGTH